MTRAEGASLFMGVTFLCTQRKVTKRNVPPTASRCALRIGTLRSSARRGTARELAALRHPRLFALAGPAVLGSLKADPDQSPQLHPADPRQAWMLLLLLLLSLLLVILTFSPP
ncbi:TPA: hypothetical protein UMV35_001587 [Stenotrophomonas maltophilia]|uniref:hypothetical protein n=1 Tax=Stenotrophomonas maltophilia TaxID=40324 RepID=UPI0013DD5A2E|nr:hypothetical protein [Stenotrophomonas maltophilia]HEL3749300.1 hypothetical protein [Stenotrophomonas maltophilia]HEL7730332.1 hypothetical protein [Stenotrophomonas maltophilia]